MGMGMGGSDPQTSPCGRQRSKSTHSTAGSALLLKPFIILIIIIIVIIIIIIYAMSHVYDTNPRCPEMGLLYFFYYFFYLFFFFLAGIATFRGGTRRTMLLHKTKDDSLSCLFVSSMSH